jgi:hypothetical protein
VSRTVLVCIALTAASWSPHAEPASPPLLSLYERGSDWPRFVASVRVHPDLWHRDDARTPVPHALVDRLARVGRDLRLLIVAEDWCTDSANTIPFVAHLASLAGVELRILDRTSGASLMTRHPSGDGRGVTPLVVFIRDGQDRGAWVERPQPLQEAFRRMADDPASHHRAAERQSWYDADQGRTALEEIVAAAERSAASQ